MNEPNQESNIYEKIVGRKKSMYFVLLQLLANGFTQEETALFISKFYKCHLTQGRISQIISKNKEPLDELTMQSELATKAGRIRKALRIIKRKGDHSLEDVLDWMKFLRTEIEGEKGVVINNTVVNKVGANGKFDGEDRELANRFMGLLRVKLQE